MKDVKNTHIDFKVKKQKTVSFQLKEDVVEDDAHSEVFTNLLGGEVSEEAVREACARVMVLDELPISFEFSEGFGVQWFQSLILHLP